MANDGVLSEAKRLWDLGFAILWLMPREKRPVGSGWTRGARKSWEELQAEYRPGFNVGVRTGSPSRLGNKGYYLACIDVDVKDEKWRADASSALRGLLSKSGYDGGGVIPSVRSGSGKGSLHVYCVTSAPFKMITVEKHESWEICVYSEGRQMALPPSIHPNGRSYKWLNSIESAKSLPLLQFNYLSEEQDTNNNKNNKKVKEVTGSTKNIEKEDWQAFVPIPLDIAWLEISEECREIITKATIGGKPIDRSAYLFRAAKELFSAGLDRDEVLSVLSDRRYKLGETGYDNRHCATRSREKVVAWLWSYTVRKAYNESSAVVAFSNAPGVLREALTGAALEAQNAEMEEIKDKPEDRGYYSMGANGRGLKPEYDALMKVFESEKPFKTICDMKTVFVFNGTHYEEISPIQIKAFAEQKFNPKPQEKIRTEFVNKILANNIVRRKQFFFDSIEGAINFKNGVLDLKDEESFVNKLLPHSPEYGFRGVLPFDYNPNARCPKFETWIRDVMQGDESLVLVLQEFMGYIVRGGDYKYHKALWLEGVGRNGKSTFVDVLKALIGSGNFSAISIKTLIGDKFAGSDLDGKLANFSEETSPNELKDTGPFKNLTGDGDIFAQKKYGDPYILRNKAKLIMTYNQIPDLGDVTKGMLSRPIIIPFRKEIADHDQDKDIKKKLLSELSGIFNFALKGWNRLEAQGEFTYSEKSMLALDKVKQESCSVHLWVNDYINENERGEEESITPALTLFEIYKTTEKYPYKKSEFYRRLKNHQLMKKHWFEEKKNGKVFYKNIKVRTASKY